MKGRTNKKGSAIAEFGPAIFVFFIIIFFPLLDVMSLTLQYAAGWYINHAVTRELAVRKESEKDQVIQEVQDAFVTSSIGNFLFASEPGRVSSVPKYIGTGTSAPGTIEVDTTVRAKPFIPVPFIPGLAGDVNFTYHSVRTREETR